MAESKSALFLGLSIALGMMATGLLVCKTAKDIKELDRRVSVKGVAEREVTADLAVLPVEFQVTGNDLIETQKRVKDQQAGVMAFLMASGIKREEIEVNTPNILDNSTREYNDAKVQLPRYVIHASARVRTNDIASVQNAARNLGGLVDKGITLSYSNSECDSKNKAQYSFTRLNDIKPQMLAEATANARIAAKQFADDSGSHVGGIHNATQGYFSVVERDASDVSPEPSYGCQNSGPLKKVRVVTTVDYYLTD